MFPTAKNITHSILLVNILLQKHCKAVKRKHFLHKDLIISKNVINRYCHVQRAPNEDLKVKPQQSKYQILLLLALLYSKALFEI